MFIHILNSCVNIVLKKNFLLNINFPVSHVRNRNSSFCKHNYSAELEAAVNKQIESEKEAAEKYLELAVRFLHPSVSYVGAGGFFMKMYEEELGHMKLFIKYQLARGGTPKLNNCKSQPDEVTLLSAFSQSLELEKKVTEQLGCLVSTAEASHDHQCADFVSSKCLEEQIFSINELAQFITILNRLGEDKHALYHFDLQLAKSFPFSLK